ncbi:helix-turn-helix transcriptional regulator [Serratia fonticola]|uniref:helix-turn-helix domain-containing protein n=1 Tax=Serratia fonticola TaxID=47917 RepID=UPI00164708E7|nr:helix-turn-helix transcriptional regulator [Serratia fonticola]MBC3250165.1 helix-turn-helix transcriptional regulator [Serratia fonticola]
MSAKLLANSECGAGTFYRHQPMQAVEALLDKVLSPQYSPSARKCRCSRMLTYRETEVLHHLARGMSGYDTAGCLGISNKTVNCHKRNAMRKLCLKSNQELYRWMELGGASYLNSTQFTWEKPDRGQ